MVGINLIELRLYHGLSIRIVDTLSVTYLGNVSDYYSKIAVNTPDTDDPVLS